MAGKKGKAAAIPQTKKSQCKGKEKAVASGSKGAEQRATVEDEEDDIIDEDDDEYEQEVPKRKRTAIASTSKPSKKRQVAAQTKDEGEDVGQEDGDEDDLTADERTLLRMCNLDELRLWRTCNELHELSPPQFIPPGYHVDISDKPMIQGENGLIENTNWSPKFCRELNRLVCCIAFEDYPQLIGIALTKVLAARLGSAQDLDPTFLPSPMDQIMESARDEVGLQFPELNDYLDDIKAIYRSKFKVKHTSFLDFIPSAIEKARACNKQYRGFITWDVRIVADAWDEYIEEKENFRLSTVAEYADRFKKVSDTKAGRDAKNLDSRSERAMLLKKAWILRQREVSEHEDPPVIPNDDGEREAPEHEGPPVIPSDDGERISPVVGSDNLPIIDADNSSEVNSSPRILFTDEEMKEWPQDVIYTCPKITKHPFSFELRPFSSDIAPWYIGLVDIESSVHLTREVFIRKNKSYRKKNSHNSRWLDGRPCLSSPDPLDGQELSIVPSTYPMNL